MDAHPLTVLVAAALVAWLAVQLWLSTRQMRHVASHADTVPAAFAGTVSAEAHRRAAHYTIARGRLGMLEVAWGAALILGWTLLGGLDLLNQAIQSVLPAQGSPAATGMAYQLALLAAFTALASLLDLPFTAWRVFGIEQRFGFNRTTWRLFLADAAKGALLSAAIGGPVAAVILWIMGAAGGLWWVWAWAAWMGINLLLVVLYPTVIAPLFNRFEPLPDTDVRRRVEALMARSGFAANGLYVMDGSRRSARGNAYFTGLGASKRVVFFDTLLAALDPREIEAVLAHEIGHFRHRHLLVRLLLSAVTSLVAFAVLGWLSSRLWFYAALGVQPSIALPNDALAIILFLLVAPIFSFFVSPLFARLSRRHEFQADAFAAREAGADALASALVKLHRDNASTLTPDPVYAGFHYSHPPAAERIAALRLDAPQPQPS